MLRVDLDSQAIRPLVEAVVSEVLTRMSAELLRAGQPCYSHADTAKMLGISSYTLHELRRAGQITGSAAGRRYAYSREAIVRYLTRAEK